MVFSDADDLKPDDRQTSPQGKILPFPARRAPDWLMGPADGLGAASDPFDDTTDETPPEALPQPVLRRPGFPASEPVPGGGSRPVGTEDGEPEEAAAAPAPPRRVAPPGVWAPVASSVPILKLALPVKSGPVDEAPAAPAARPPGLPAPDDDLPRVFSTPPPLAPLREAWWVIALDAMRTSRSVQLAVVGALVVVALSAYWMWPRGVGLTSLSELHRYPARFDGRSVAVRGRVGDDVFAVGAGWAFYLTQGRDTIVAFTRTQSPKPHDVIIVKGQVSTGFLDGVPRQALFEDAPPAN
jgi:hypothetical protein